LHISVCHLPPGTSRMLNEAAARSSRAAKASSEVVIGIMADL
jgi:hypothetical protein